MLSSFNHIYTDSFLFLLKKCSVSLALLFRWFCFEPSPVGWWELWIHSFRCPVCRKLRPWDSPSWGCFRWWSVEINAIRNSSRYSGMVASLFHSSRAFFSNLLNHNTDVFGLISTTFLLCQFCDSLPYIRDVLVSAVRPAKQSQILNF